MKRLSEASAARLRIAMRPHRLTHDQLAKEWDVSKSSVLRILNGDADLPAGFEKFVTTKLDTTVDAILQGEQRVPDTIVEVPMFDVQVAAGSGRLPLDEAETIGVWPFPTDWITASFPGAELKLVRVSGDSQEPELRDGDMVMIDTRNPQVREGMQVVRLGDALLIKRLQLQSGTVRLLSANPAYAPIVIDRAEAEAIGGFAVVGRAVWASKLL